MATRREIKIAIRNALISAVAPVLSEEYIVHSSGETRNLDFPHIVFHLFDVPNPRFGTKPPAVDTVFNEQGEKIQSVYLMHYDAFVDIQINGDPRDCDDLYELVREFFLPFYFWERSQELHPDITDIELREANTPINRDTEPSVFETTVNLELEYKKYVTRDGKPITEIHQNYDYDADDDPTTIGDGQTDLSYTTE